MTSIFQRALGADFDRLHPQLQRRFGFSSEDGVACVGYGWMDEVWHGGGITRPFLALGATRHILVPGTGQHVPFSIQNYAYRDRFGREALTFARTFWFGDRPRRWDATMIYSPEAKTIVDYLGTHQHLAVDLHLSVGADGSLVISSGAQRLHERLLSFGVPRMLTGTAQVRESYDDDLELFRIEVSVTNQLFGRLFGYHGSFIATYPEGRQVPDSVRPVRETPRA